ncbi:Bgt-1444 [Blumeria graminis f. sp. tritici]|uniref:Condensin complex subunit 1 n=2 Tax=Blumeria graminis f. sp. tritici TaxID=62690 RepID=A0A9X9MIA4_BLUGR|nr:Non-SMC subunit of the condensin complex (Smc2p-Smc4p-Ycs4p-Brn1p-Ycg1p) [Blumeria graminis f. sp. tritici 96224]VDB88791.1 Bgt-1444 [Blumeria graminis f. sp. tritici]
MDNIEFDINCALKHYMSDPASIATPEADSNLLDCDKDPELLTDSLVNSILDSIVDAVAGNPEAIIRRYLFDSLQFLLKSSSILSINVLSKILDLIVSALSIQVDNVHSDLESDEQEVLANHKQLLEVLSFLLQWAISTVETKITEKSTTAPAVRVRGKSTKVKAGGKSHGSAWDPTTQLQTALDKRDTLIGLLTRPVYMVLESEQRTKNTTIRMHAFKVLCTAIKHHGHGYAAQISIIQNLTYFEHLAEPMAEFLHILSEQYDYPQLTDEILRELSNKEYNSNDTKGPKSVSSFMVKLSELVPRNVLKQMTLLAKQLDSESYTLRCALIEVCGNLIVELSRQEERNENHKTQLNAFFDVLEERFLDLNPYCRCRTIQVYIKLCDLEQKFPKRRQRVAELAARSLGDKSSNVRRNSIKLLRSLIKTHPFSIMHGSQLSMKEWTARLQEIDAELNELNPPTETIGFGEKEQVDQDLLDDATVVESESSQKIGKEETLTDPPENSKETSAKLETIKRLTLTRRYYAEALKFIKVLHDATPTICQLLGSKNKSEVIEAMDYFEIGDAYNIEQNKLGIRRMLRLIWTKGNSDEGKAVQNHLIECYNRLFFEAPDVYSSNDAANYIARNMISLTFGATPAELTSLEQLLNNMMDSNYISDLVISKLWQVYGVDKREISRSQRRGSIIVLGMLARAKPEIVIGEIETMLRIGLGRLGWADFNLSKYTCIALGRINSTERKTKVERAQFAKLSNDHLVLQRLAAMVAIETDNKEWYGVAEQALNAIYALSQHPDTLCSEILRKKSYSVFQRRETQTQQYNKDTNASRLLTPPPEEPEDPEIPENRVKGSVVLSQLLFIVGHIAIKQIVYLELCELHFKRVKAEAEKIKVPAAESANQSTMDASDDLDLIGGTTEDDFTEAIAHIRERELLYGDKSLLANFGPLATEICSNIMTYRDQNLQAAATLCLAKLMCVSSEYCESNLPLLITILERSENPIIRSNAVVALGDIAVCFNHLIDENTDFLYRRLSDKDASVKRTCLMTLTFLILAGQVKVKGQLGEMAKCLEDGDKRIADLSRMFFTELSTKDNAVYNHFIDMFSLLSAEKNLEEDAMRRITKFLTGFIEKVLHDNKLDLAWNLSNEIQDKHAKQLADKLAARLARCETERQWNDVAYALSLLQHKNEDINKQISGGFKMVQATS